MLLRLQEKSGNIPGADAPGHQALSSAEWLGFGGKRECEMGSAASNSEFAPKA